MEHLSYPITNESHIRKITYVNVCWLKLNISILYRTSSRSYTGNLKSSRLNHNKKKNSKRNGDGMTNKPQQKLKSAPTPSRLHRMRNTESNPFVKKSHNKSVTVVYRFSTYFICSFLLKTCTVLIIVISFWRTVKYMHQWWKGYARYYAILASQNKVL